MKYHADIHGTLSNRRHFSVKIRNRTDGRKLVQQEINRDIEHTVLAVIIRVVDKGNEQHGEEQGHDEFVGVMAVRENAEISARLLSGKRHINAGGGEQRPHFCVIHNPDICRKVHNEVAAKIR